MPFGGESSPAIQRIRFHDLRHCHATHLLRARVNPKVVQERLGHSTPAFTLAVYGHSLPGMQEEAARALAVRLLGTTPELSGGLNWSRPPDWSNGAVSSSGA